MPERSQGDMAQIRVISEQAADIALSKHMAAHPPQKAEVPLLLKLAAGIMVALFTAFVLWMVTTLNEMQITVARIDERQQSQSGDLTGKFADIDRRLSTLEAFHRTNGGEK